MGAINQRTGSFRGGLVCAGISLLASAMLMIALRQKAGLENEPIATAQESPAVLPMTDVES